MDTAEFVQCFYEDFRTREFDKIAEHIAEHATFVWMANPEHLKGFGGIAAGKPAFVERLHALESEFEYSNLDLHDIIANGERAAVQIHLSMKRRSTGETFDMPVAGFFTFEDGKVARYVEYYDTALGEKILAG